MRSILVFLFLSRYLCAQPASFAGIALNSITRKPLDGIHITIYVLRRRPAREFYGAMTDKDGHFSIANPPPAKYGFSAPTRYARAKQDGAYSLPNLPPGSYKLVAVPEDDADLILQEAGLAEYGDAMTNVEVGDGEKISRDLAVVSILR